MADISLYVRFDNEDSIHFVQGEDREVTLSFGDRKAELPISLTGCQVALHLPRAGLAGGAIKRRLDAVPASYAGSTRISTGMTIFSLQSHGLVSGETISVTSMGQAGLPSPMLTATQYTVSAVNNDTFGLLSPDGTPLVVTESLPMDFYLEQTDAVTVIDENFGLVSVKLPDIVTNAVAPGRAQPLQVVLKDASGLTRVFLQTYGLDVDAQVLA